MFNKSRAAVDIGNHSAKIVEYKPIKKGITISKISRIEGLNNKNLIDDLVKSIDSKQLTLMLSNSDSMLVKEVPVKELKNQIKNLTQNGYSADYTKLDDDLYLLAHVEAETVKKIVLPLMKAKKQVVAVDTNASAMLYLAKVYEDDFETKIFLDIGHLSSKVLIIHQGKVVKYTKFDTGIFHIIEGIKENIGASHARTLELVWRLGLNKNQLPVNANELLDDFNITEVEYGHSVQDRMDYFLNRLADALRSNIAFKADDSKLILIGGGPLIGGVEEVIRETLSIEVETFSLVSSTAGEWKVINNTEQKIDSSYALAVGLALREVAK